MYTKCIKIIVPLNEISNSFLLHFILIKYIFTQKFFEKKNKSLVLLIIRY